MRYFCLLMTLHYFFKMKRQETNYEDVNKALIKTDMLTSRLFLDSSNRWFSARKCNCFSRCMKTGHVTTVFHNTFCDRMLFVISESQNLRF